MKKTILLIALALISTTTFAQKKDTIAKKPVVVKQFNIDYQAERVVKLTIDDVSLLMMTPEQWQQLEWSQQKSGQQIQQTKAAATAARQKLVAQINALVKADEEKFKADTAKRKK